MWLIESQLHTRGTVFFNRNRVIINNYKDAEDIMTKVQNNFTDSCRQKRIKVNTVKHQSPNDERTFIANRAQSNSVSIFSIEIIKIPSNLTAQQSIHRLSPFKD